MNGYADLIFLNGSVLTMDSNNTIHEALAVKGCKILRVGQSVEMEKLKGPQTQIIDLNGRTLMPGFIDAHCHAGVYGTAKKQLLCSGTNVRSIADIISLIQKKAKSTPTDQWIVARGYNESRLIEKKHPTRWDLDQASRDHMIFLQRTCSHFAVVNSRVIKEMGIDRKTLDPEGGRYERDASGEPNGILAEQAVNHLRNHILPSEKDIYEGLHTLNQDFLEFGITSVHDASGLSSMETRQFQKAISDEILKLRVYLMFRFLEGTKCLGESLIESGLMTGFGNNRLRIGPYKLILDGTGSGGTAAMYKPSPSGLQDTGILYFSMEALEKRLLRAHTAGYQIAVHAIGNRALDMVIECFEKILKRFPKLDHRHRIEHFGFPSDMVVKKVKKLGIIPIIGLPFLYELGDLYLENFGLTHTDQAYPLKKLIKAGIPAALSSDTPVISPNPLHGIHFALNRKAKSGHLIAPNEKADLLPVLKSYTIHGAFASFEERVKGSLEIGKLADMIVLSENIQKTPVADVLRLSVETTVIDGQIVYQRE